jgi:cell division septum initiation protein DivIVA
MAQGDRDPPGDGHGVPRASFDVVARGYDRDQVDGYLQALWRYCGDLTARVAAAEAALRHERDRRAADNLTGPAQAGARVGRMLAIAQQMADEIVGGARLTAEQTLYEAVRDAGAAHPVAQEAREQADKLLADAVAEARRLARERHEDLEAKVAVAAASLEAVRRQQGELLGALLRLRGMVGSGDFERTVGVLARAGAVELVADGEDPTDEPPPAGPAAAAQPPQTAPSPRAAQPPPADGTVAPTPAGRPAPHRVPAGAGVRDGALYPVESPPVSPPAGGSRAGGEIIDVEVVADGDSGS